MKIAIISHPECELHDPGEGHPEQPARVKVIQHALKHYSFRAPVTFYEAPLADESHLMLAHDESYVGWLAEISPQQNMLSIDADTWMNPHTWNAALRAAGSVIMAVDLVMSRSANVAFCNVRPPGHHALHDKAMGFCFFNNVVVGAAYAMEKYGLNRIVIVDFDVHHGNGTQDIIKQDSRVLYCSSFEHPFYPGYEEDPDQTNILAVPLPAGTSGETFRSKVKTAWFEQIAAFQPQLIFFSAGFDAHADDPLANLVLQKEDYVWLTEEIAKIAAETCEGKMISVLEGGYHLKVLSECVPAHVDAMVKIEVR